MTLPFLASILIKSENSVECLVNYYNSISFNPAKNTMEKYNNDIVKIEVLKMDSSKINSIDLEHQEIEFSSLKGIDSLDNYYAVIIFDDGYY